MFVVSGQLSVVSCQLSVVSCQLSVVSGQWSVVSCQLSVVLLGTLFFVLWYLCLRPQSSKLQVQRTKN
jgi:hypothetical protein